MSKAPTSSKSRRRQAMLQPIIKVVMAGSEATATRSRCGRIAIGRSPGSCSSTRPPRTASDGSASNSASIRASQCASTRQSSSVNAMTSPRAARTPALRARDSPGRVSTREWTGTRVTRAASATTSRVWS
jgi:hypothetical protein